MTFEGEQVGNSKLTPASTGARASLSTPSPEPGATAKRIRHVEGAPSHSLVGPHLIMTALYAVCRLHTQNVLRAQLPDW